jgi:hypothetical protein
MALRLQPYAPAALYPQEYSWYSFLLEAESTPGPYCDWRSRSIEKLNDFVGNWSRDLPACSIVPQATTLPLALKIFEVGSDTLWTVNGRVNSCRAVLHVPMLHENLSCIWTASVWRWRWGRGQVIISFQFSVFCIAVDLFGAATTTTPTNASITITLYYNSSHIELLLDNESVTVFLLLLGLISSL